MEKLHLGMRGVFHLTRLLTVTEDRVRTDVAILKQDGIEMVIANGNGFSAFDHLIKIMKKPGNKVWKIKKGASDDALLLGRSGSNSFYRILFESNKC